MTDSAGWRHPTPTECDAWEAFCTTLTPLAPRVSGQKKPAPLRTRPTRPQGDAEVEDFGALLAEFDHPATTPTRPLPHVTATPKPIASPAMRPIPPRAHQGIDARQLRDLRRGKLAMDAVLDLHGYSVPAAFSRLKHALVYARQQGHRVVLVITGKGTRDNANSAGKGTRDNAIVTGKGSRDEVKTIGKLRAALPQWLQDGAIAPHVITASPAISAHGGVGAWYVLLRRRERGDAPEHRGWHLTGSEWEQHHE